MPIETNRPSTKRIDNIEERERQFIEGAPLAEKQAAMPDPSPDDYKVRTFPLKWPESRRRKVEQAAKARNMSMHAYIDMLIDADLTR